MNWEIKYLPGEASLGGDERLPRRLVSVRMEIEVEADLMVLGLEWRKKFLARDRDLKSARLSICRFSSRGFGFLLTFCCCYFTKRDGLVSLARSLAILQKSVGNGVPHKFPCSLVLI